MTLLTPGVMLGALALTAPVLITLYLLKLRRRPLTVSSTMFWVDQGKDLEVNVPLRMIRPSWMLLLHALALALLLLALGRPVVPGGPSAAENLFIIIDRSMSMNATDGASGGTRFDEAREEARAFVRDLERNGYRGRIALIAFAASAELIAGPTEDPAEIRRALELLEPTDQPGELRAALELVESMAERGIANGEAGETSGSRNSAEAVLISDGQSPGTTLSLAGASFRFEPVGPAARDEPAGQNAGLVAAAAVRDYRDPAVIRIFVRAQSTRPNDNRLPVEVLVSGERERLIAVELTPADSGSLDLLSGAAGFTLERPEQTMIELRLAGTDALAADDTAVLVVTPARRSGIRLVRPAERADNDAAWLLEETLLALEPASFEVIPADRYDPSSAFTGLTVFDRVSPVRWPGGPSLSFGAPGALAGRPFAQLWCSGRGVSRQGDGRGGRRIGRGLAAGRPAAA